jgi:predicted Zn finger-like uncharacterized protein
MVSNPLTDRCYGPQAGAVARESHMHLVCPKCRTSYQLDAASVGAGRSVRCARCKNVWFAGAAELQAGAADAVQEEAAFREELGPQVRAGSETDQPVPSTTIATEGPAPNTPPEIMPAAGSEQAPHMTDPGAEPPSGASYLKTPAIDSPPLAATTADNPVSPASTAPKEPEDVESVAARRMPASKIVFRRRSVPKSKLPLMILMLVTACAAIIGWRKDIVRHAPQMASLYGLLGLPVNVRGLVFTDVKIGNETHDGVPVLTVEGTIASVVSDTVEVPRLRFALRNGTGQEVYSWTAIPTQNLLTPGDTLPFRSRIASPPGDVQDVQVRFFNRRDAAAGGH